MADENELLSLIEDAIAAHGGDLGGWTQLTEDSLKIFDGRVTLSALIDEPEDNDVPGMIHAHVLAVLHEYDDEVLDTCLIGVGDDMKSCLAEVALIWMTCVAGPIRSFLDNTPVCMTCQAGVVDGDVSQGDYGLPGLRAYVGPYTTRMIEDESITETIDDQKPWFRYAAESASPKSVHLAKVTFSANDEDGWDRQLEIDGHEVSHSDPNWPAGVAIPDVGFLTRFAVFEFPRNSQAIKQRAELDKIIRFFITNYHKFKSVDDLMRQMFQQGMDRETVCEVESISTLAFTRIIFESHGVEFPSVVYRARKDGRIEKDVPLMSLPAFSRGRAIIAELSDDLSEEEFQSICLYSAEAHAILNSMENDDSIDLNSISLAPSLVPEFGVSNETMDRGLKMIMQVAEDSPTEEPSPTKKKPWWKFW